MNDDVPPIPEKLVVFQLVGGPRDGELLTTHDADPEIAQLAWAVTRGGQIGRGIWGTSSAQGKDSEGNLPDFETIQPEPHEYRVVERAENEAAVVIRLELMSADS